MITKAKFTNFKLLRDVEVPLGRFNVLVGANGVGKSSVLEGLHYLLQLASVVNTADGERGGRASALFRGPRDPSLLASRSGNGASGAFDLAVVGDRIREFGVSCKRREGEEGYQYSLRFHGDEPDVGPMDYSLESRNLFVEMMLKRVAKTGLASVVRLRLDATRLGEDHYSEEKNPSVEYDGEGLASVLQELLGARDGRFEAIERDLALVVPGAQRIRITRARIVRTERIRISIDGQESWSEQQREYSGSGIEIEWAKVGWVPASHLSEGTLLALGVVSVLHHRPPRMILLDDLDKGLHPTAQQELVDLLRKVCDQNPGLQVLATTHSPYVVDKMSPEDVLVCAGTEDRGTQIRRLSEHPTWSKQKDYLQPGEFWSATGEKWVAEPRA